jgi:hypothetical protein
VFDLRDIQTLDVLAKGVQCIGGFFTDEFIHIESCVL